MLVLIATILTVQGLYGMQKQKLVPFVGLACGSISLISSLLLIPRFGAYGAIYAWIAAEIAEIAIDLIIIIRSSRKAVCTI
jgi:PST family polysaccharide transporter